jgi:cell division protein FtsL
MQSGGKIMKKTRIRHHKPGIGEKWISSHYVFGFLVLVLLVTNLVAYMYMRNHLNLVSSSNLLLKEHCSRLEQENIFLESEINELKRPGHIRRIAQEELGMISSKPKADAVIVVKRHD